MGFTFTLISREGPGFEEMTVYPAFVHTWTNKTASMQICFPRGHSRVPWFQVDEEYPRCYSRCKAFCADCQCGADPQQDFELRFLLHTWETSGQCTVVYLGAFGALSKTNSRGGRARISLLA
jgi:hypothetical protein